MLNTGYPWEKKALFCSLKLHTLKNSPPRTARRIYSRFQFRSKIPCSVNSSACGVRPCACGLALHITAFPAQFRVSSYTVRYRDVC